MKQDEKNEVIDTLEEFASLVAIARDSPTSTFNKDGDEYDIEGIRKSMSRFKITEITLGENK